MSKEQSMKLRKNKSQDSAKSGKNVKKSDNTAFFPRILPWILLPITPVLLTLSYPKFTYSWLAWLALAPFSYFLLKAGSWKSLITGSLLCGFLSYLGILYWIYPTMRAGAVPVPFAVLGIVLLCLIMSLDFVLTGSFCFFVRRTGPGAFPLLFASAWACMEWIKVCINLKAVSFPWFILAYSQWQQPEFMQIASIAGPYSLSWALAFAGALTASLFVRREPIARKLFSIVPALLLMGGLWIFGHGMMSYEMQPDDRPVEIHASLLQPCISLYDKWDAAKENYIRGKLYEMSEKSQDRDIVLWPENALPGWIDDPQYSMYMDAIAKKFRSNHIVGSVSRGDGKRVAAFLITPQGEEGDYHKRVLVPFGEYVPMRGFLGKYIGTIGMLGEFVPGNFRQNFMRIKGLNIAPTICYESIFPFLYSSDAERGADMFVNITNDGWYLDTSAPYQHLAALAFRAVETRRPILRAANNGISAYISSNGVIEKMLPLDQEGVLEVDMSVHSGQPPSVYARYGNFFAIFCLIICLAFAVSIVFMR